MTINLETAFSNDALGEQKKAETLERDKAIREQMSPPGTLHLPPLLEKRRWEYGIIDAEVVQQQALYDRVLIHQLDGLTSGGKTFLKNGLIQKTDQRVSLDEKEAPRGIIVGAGLKGLDILRSNGFDLGHRVLFQKMTPYGIEVGRVMNIARRLLILIAGDILASEDTATLLREGKLKLIQREGRHQYEDDKGNTVVPLDPWQSAEY